jgi:mevalonate kinase
MSYDFETISYGKWILAGEHAVLRGHPALVFPLKHKALTLQYTPTTHPLILNYAGENQNTCESSIWTLLNAGLSKLQLAPTQLTGQLNITNHIPIGTGLGASAAICVAITRWLKTYFEPNLNCFEFSRELEHVFHGKSSGLDVAGSMSTSDGIYFQAGTKKSFVPTWQPRWRLSYSGNPGITSNCISKIEQLKQNNPSLTDALDLKMAHAVTQAHTALIQHNLSNLVGAIKDAASCFKDWGLINQPLEAHINTLYAAGALAVKPTGSGEGGYVLSLWPDNLTPQPDFQWIQL